MRSLFVSIGAPCAACFGVTCAVAQSGQWGQAEQQPPHHTHVDRRLGHDHVYPDPMRVGIQPRNGQGANLQARDRYTCYRFAVAQSGFDPLASSRGATVKRSSDYSRAQAACLEGRGDTVQ